MAAKKKKTCVAGHDPSSNCGDCGAHCCAVTPERGAEIREQARSRNNWASISPVRPTHGGKS